MHSSAVCSTPCILVLPRHLRLATDSSLEAIAIAILLFWRLITIWYQPKPKIKARDCDLHRRFHFIKMAEFSGFVPRFDTHSSTESDQDEEEGQSLSYGPDDDEEEGEEVEEQSPSYEPDDEEEREEGELDQDPSPGPSRPHAPQNPSASTSQTVIPSNGFAPAYDCPIIAKLSASNPLPHPLPVHFAHLNCFHLTPPHTSPSASVIELKQHAQAVCLLLSLLQPTSDPDKWPNVPADPPFPAHFDFLSDLTEPYPGSQPNGGVQKYWHDKPLPGLSNTLESGHPGIGDIEQCTKAELLLHANKLLTRLDHVYNSTGGILSIPPPPPPPLSPEANEPHTPTGLAQDSILAQWLGYTRALTLRLASLEKETAALREVLGHEALVAGVRGKQARAQTSNGDGCGEHELVFPQDRYVLAGLSEGLWARLHDELSAREGDDREERAHERDERAQGRGVQGAGWGDFSTTPGDDARETNVVAWIETPSRLYRIRGHDTIFVIPGFGLHPGAPAVHRVERTPLVQTVPERRAHVGGGTAWERDVAARASAQAARIAALDAHVARLRRELEAEKIDRQRLAADAELRGRRAR